jgi:hypothetical protein
MYPVVTGIVLVSERLQKTKRKNFFELASWPLKKEAGSGSGSVIQCKYRSAVPDPYPDFTYQDL